MINSTKTQNNISFNVPMSLENARNTIWPFRDLKGQRIGTLYDGKKIGLKDLSFAVESAYDPKVRQASQVVMLAALKQRIETPPPDAGYIHIFSGGRSYSEREQLRLSFIEGGILGLGLGICSVVFIWLLVAQKSAAATTNSQALLSNPSVVIVSIALIIYAVIFVAVVLFGMDWLMKRLDKTIESHHYGEAGEDKVAEIISQVMDGNWVLFRNVVLPGRNWADLDAVLLGPKGVYVFEVKNLSGEYKNIGDLWEYKRGNKWAKASVNPSDQVQKNASRLNNFFTADGIKQWVTPVVVWVNANSLSKVENPTVAVWTLDQLVDELEALNDGKSAVKDTITKITDKLARLASNNDAV